MKISMAENLANFGHSNQFCGVKQRQVGMERLDTHRGDECVGECAGWAT